MELKKLYEIYSLIIGMGSVILFVGFMFGSIVSTKFVFCLNEPVLWIAIPEMILGSLAIPYYIKKMKEIKHG